MVGWLLLSFGVAFGSAILPVVSVEMFLIGLCASQPTMPWLLLGAIVAAGQVGGKTLYYLAAKGTIKLPKPLHDRLHRERPPTPRRERWRARTKKMRARLDALRERCHRHPHWMAGTYGVSSILGLPPYMATSVLAGLVKMPLASFLATGFLGRWLRFSLLAASPALFAGWFHY
ncbi:YqaA family protein [Amycolatopsis alba]|uniref:DedA family protein n=1 Tax=Amycolatopsis alba DSM 44262 TaxID=1125972 RepID=A0A229RS48_AMYAL|nr:membrane protein [Amycolatopsis alba]OXM49224.1 hypothetical protein CFP75_19810 [Amycolatopsis alba DSM 44262]